MPVRTTDFIHSISIRKKIAVSFEKSQGFNPNGRLYLLFFIIISALFLLNACSKDVNISQREQNLLVQKYHGYPIPIDSLHTFDDLIEFLDISYCEKHNPLWPTLYLDMKKKTIVDKANKNTIVVGIEPSPCVDGELQYDPRMILEIVKDGHNTTIEREFTEIDSIPNYVKKQMLSFGADPNYAIGALNNGIWICTKKSDDLKQLYPYIYESVIGFLQSAQKYSQLAYHKKIEDLSPKEYAELAHEFSLHLSFKYTDKEPSIQLDF